jgi:hypothetical protein
MKLTAALKDGVFKLLKQPKQTLFSIPLGLVWGVYCATYIAANSIDVYNERS